MVEVVVRRVWREERKRESNIILFELKIHFKKNVNYSKVKLINET